MNPVKIERQKNYKNMYLANIYLRKLFILKLHQELFITMTDFGKQNAIDFFRIGPFL